jgi:hypothetical protein
MMRERLRAAAVSCLFAGAASSIAVEAQKPPALPEVLSLAGDYLAQYSGKLSAIAAEEHYLQYDVSSGEMREPKRLSADIVLTGLADGIEGFRDVFAVDTVPLRPRDDRLALLFASVTPSAVEQARTFTRASVERYLNANLHGLDQPALALEFVRKEHQARSTFKIESVKATDGARVAVVRVTERQTPRLVPSAEGAPATGRIWVDVASGTVRQTELSLTSKSFSVRATVTYGLQPELGMWLPVQMIQHFSASGPGSNPINHMGANGGYNARQSFEGHATYSRYRRLTGSGPAS